LIDANLRDWDNAPKLDAQKLYVEHTTAAYGDIYARAVKVHSRTKEISSRKNAFSLHREQLVPVYCYTFCTDVSEYESFYFPGKKGIF